MGAKTVLLTLQRHYYLLAMGMEPEAKQAVTRVVNLRARLLTPAVPPPSLSLNARTRASLSPPLSTSPSHPMHLANTLEGPYAGACYPPQRSSRLQSFDCTATPLSSSDSHL